MKRKILVLLFFMLSKQLILFSQDSLRDTVPFSSLPDTLRKTIQDKVSSLINLDTLQGKLAYTKNQINRIYTYKLFLKNNQLFSYYQYYHDCIGCMTSESAGFTTAFTLYCCKDPTHHPQETAKTKDGILAIQKKNKCSRVGICIY